MLFWLPPEIESSAPAAVLALPPPITLRTPSAPLCSPPVMVVCSPAAVLKKPPAIDSVALGVQVLLSDSVAVPVLL